jgi:hypothetical protein
VLSQCRWARLHEMMKEEGDDHGNDDPARCPAHPEIVLVLNPIGSDSSRSVDFSFSFGYEHKTSTSSTRSERDRRGVQLSMQTIGGNGRRGGVRSGGSHRFVGDALR